MSDDFTCQEKSAASLWAQCFSCTVYIALSTFSRELENTELENTSLEELVDKTLVSTHIIGYTDEAVTDGHRCRGQWLAALSDERNKCLAMGAVIIQRARDAVKEKTGFTCSAGIAHNKVCDVRW